MRPDQAASKLEGFICPSCETGFSGPKPDGRFTCPACGAESPSVLPHSANLGGSFVTQLITELDSSDPRRYADLRSGNCDLCGGGRIHDGSGYVFYSSQERNGATEGIMFLCERCTSGIVLRLRDGSLLESNPLFGLFAPEYGEGEKMYPVHFAAMNSIDAIVDWCRFHGLSPEGAAAKARELAEMCYSEPMRGRSMAIAFWNPMPTRPLLTAVSTSGRREGSSYRYQIRIETVNKGNLTATWAGLTIHFLNLTSKEQLNSHNISALASGGMSPIQYAPGDLIWGFSEDRSWGQKAAKCLMIESVAQNWKIENQIALEILLTHKLPRLDVAIRAWASWKKPDGSEISDGDPAWSTEVGRDQQGIPCYERSIKAEHTPKNDASRVGFWKMLGSDMKK
jgi:hypothetical protein